MFLLYKPTLFLHILFGFIYMLAHGASAAAAYRLRQETSLERIRALLDLSGSTFRVMFASLLGMLLAGVALGFLGRWWSSGWIWVSLGLLIALGVFMSLVASRHFHRVRKAAGLPYLDGTKEHPPMDPVSPAELEAVVRSGNPNLITLVGVGGWAVILWMMIDKPF